MPLPAKLCLLNRPRACAVVDHLYYISAKELLGTKWKARSIRNYNMSVPLPSGFPWEPSERKTLLLSSEQKNI